MSLEFLNAFKFMKKESFLHNLDPRAKLVLALIYSIGGLLFNQIIPLLLIFLSLIPLIIVGRLFKQWIKRIGVKRLLLMILLHFILLCL
ncbi:hypothetical protein LCGC14_2200420 [marine sediment metagenome]|uniref:Cobalt transport protein n=1 Tax=marine sediment metagenome TaxID=412755 RepID=A0A0F9DH46_9ZZZZ